MGSISPQYVFRSILYKLSYTHLFFCQFFQANVQSLTIHMVLYENISIWVQNFKDKIVCVAFFLKIIILSKRDNLWLFILYLYIKLFICIIKLRNIQVETQIKFFLCYNVSITHSTREQHIEHQYVQNVVITHEAQTQWPFSKQHKCSL